MRLIYYLAVALIAVCIQAYTAKASVGTRGGGNVNAAEFAERADQTINKISILDPVVVNGFEINGSRMKSIFEKAKIFAVNSPLRLDGKPVNAINDPTRLEIYFDEIAWQNLSPNEKTQLVIHEFIGLSFPEISDLNYSYSSQLLQLIQSVARDLKIHCRLTALDQSSPDDYEVVEESMSWVSQNSVTKATLADFDIQFLLKDSYLKITLTSPLGQVLIDTIQYVGHTLDFESKVPFKSTTGNSLDTLNLMCEEALGQTP